MDFIIYFLSAYLIGSLMAGYFVVKFLGKKDLRMEGSMNVGARNAGRVKGKSAFVLTFLGDALKGAAIVLAGKYFGFSPEAVIAGLGFAILGHLKPITLKFKGGMGISTFIGGIITFEPATAMVILAGFLVLYPFFKSFTLAGLGAFSFIPFALAFFEQDFVATLEVTVLILVIYFVHREDLKDRFMNRTIKT